jgi:replication-associated recombination protein RarA
VQQPHLNIAVLRDIAAEKWDVASALGASKVRSGAYDSYLLRAATLLRQGAPNDDVADYFINIATEEVGVDTGSGIRARALILVKALREQLSAVAQPIPDVMMH